MILYSNTTNAFIGMYSLCFRGSGIILAETQEDPFTLYGRKRRSRRRRKFPTCVNMRESIGHQPFWDRCPAPPQHQPQPTIFTIEIFTHVLTNISCYISPILKKLVAILKPFKFASDPRKPHLTNSMRSKVTQFFFYRNVIFFTKPLKETEIATNKITITFLNLGHFEALMFL